MTGGKRRLDEPASATPSHKIRRLNSPLAVAHRDADPFGDVDDKDLLAAYTVWEKETAAQQALETDVVPGNVTPALLVAAFHQLGHKSANDIIKRLDIPPGTWAEDLRHLERLRKDWSGHKPITDEDAYAQLERSLRQMETGGLLAVVSNVAKHLVDEGATGPAACAKVGFPGWHTDLAGKIYRYAAQRQVDAGMSVDEACRINRVAKDQQNYVLDYALERWAEAQQAKKRDARRHTSAGPFPIDPDEEDTLLSEPPGAAGIPQAPSRPAGLAPDATPGRWMAKAIEIVQARDSTRRTASIDPDLTQALRERMQGVREGGEWPQTTPSDVVRGVGLSKTAFRGKIWDLGRALATYREKHRHERKGAPYLDIIGIRDHAVPRSSDSSERRQIDRLLDEIVPPDTRYDTIRQNIIDLTLDSPAAAVAAPLSSRDRLYDSESAVADRLILDLHESRQLQFHSSFKTSQAMRDGFNRAMTRIADSTHATDLVTGLNHAEIKLKTHARIDALFDATDRISSEVRRVRSPATQSKHDPDGGRASRIVAMARANVMYLVSELIPDQDGCVVHRRAIVELVANRRDDWADPASPELNEMEAMFLPTAFEHEIRREPDAPYGYKMQAAWHAEKRLRLQSKVDLPRQEAKLRALAREIGIYMHAVADRATSRITGQAERQTQPQDLDHANQRAVADRVRMVGHCR